MFKAKKLPVQNYLRALFHYKSGALIWKKRPRSHFASKNAWGTWNTRFAGEPAGSINAKGYLDVSIDGCLYRVHRVIWAMHFGEIPDGMQMDHINHVKSDNRIENLRIVTPLINQKNKSQHKNNSSGVTGVYWNKCNKKWDVYIGSEGKLRRIGSFSCKSKAISVRKLAEVEAGFHPNHGEILTQEKRHA